MFGVYIGLERIRAVLRIALPVAVALDLVHSFYYVALLVRDRMIEMEEEHNQAVMQCVEGFMLKVGAKCQLRDSSFWPQELTGAMAAFGHCPVPQDPQHHSHGRSHGDIRFMLSPDPLALLLEAASAVPGSCKRVPEPGPDDAFEQTRSICENAIRCHPKRHEDQLDSSGFCLNHTEKQGDDRMGAFGSLDKGGHTGDCGDGIRAGGAGSCRPEGCVPILGTGGLAAVRYVAEAAAAMGMRAKAAASAASERVCHKFDNGLSELSVALGPWLPFPNLIICRRSALRFSVACKGPPAS
eukprot:evm.model.scf_1483.2 EVM.evm.TU.scf_1483.2   scf_1483:10921-13574(-)